jgi:dihydrofolate synthase/folylpolyglutamate synthase
MNDISFSEAAYSALLQDIFSRFPSVQRAGFSVNAYKPGLEGMQSFDEALGHPSRAFRSIHVAGTNGKGSVANMLASALASCGLRTGLYTSPHLVDFRERMLVAEGSSASLIPKEYVFNFLTQWQPYFLEHQLSFFEITTGLAFKWFADSGVDVAVVEVGLGGRLDSTNILLPALSIVTTIGLDHCALLGNTLQEIAAEKAGIFKTGVPALVGESQEETAPVFKETAWMRCPLSFADHLRPSLWHRHAEILKKMDLRAPVQKKNLRTVLAAVDILREMPPFQALQNADAVLEGIEHTARNMKFHGRWERLSEQPYVLADIGHNAHALQYNFRELEALVQSGRYSSLIIVYGIMADKDLDAILPLMPRDATYIFTTPETPRALPAGEILRRFTEFRGGASTRAFFSSSVRQAVQMAVQLAQNLGGPSSRSASAENLAPPLIYIGGSTFVVSEAVPIFR